MERTHNEELKNIKKKNNFSSRKLFDLRKALRSKIQEGELITHPYDGKSVTIIGLFVWHNWTTTEIAYFSRQSEPCIRRVILDTCEKLGIDTSNN